MTFDDFRREVRAELGDDLSGATPDSVREFVARWQQSSLGQSTRETPLRLDEPLGNYASIVRNFYRRVLDANADEAAIALWLATAEMLFNAVDDNPPPTNGDDPEE